MSLGFAFFFLGGKLNLLDKCTKQVTIATELQKELLPVFGVSHSFLSGNFHSGARDLTADTLILACPDKREGKRNTEPLGGGEMLVDTGSAILWNMILKKLLCIKALPTTARTYSICRGRHPNTGDKCERLSLRAGPGLDYSRGQSLSRLRSLTLV